MSWNIALLTTKGPKSLIDDILPDIYFNARTGLYFDEATSSSIGPNLAVGYKDEQIVIIDVLGRIISDDRFPREISQKNNSCKVFWISENCIYRTYADGQMASELTGPEQTSMRLHELDIPPIDKWGETLIFQLFDHEVFGMKRNTQDLVLSEMRFDLYQLD